MPSETDELQELLEKAEQYLKPSGPEATSRTPPKNEKGVLEHCQWEVLPNGIFIATGNTKPRLEPGAYTVATTDDGRALFIAKKILTDSLIDLGDSNSTQVITGIRNFWTKRDRYHAKGLLYKRGVLMWGPAGSGKTATLSLLVQDLIKMGGIVLLVQNPSAAVFALPILRKIEPDRPLIVVLEDIEEIIQAHGEHALLALLDGEHQTDNVCNIATTNYPEMLGARIVNRPSRFDEVHKIGFPSAQMREVYLRHALKTDAKRYPLPQWVEATEGMSIAHLKELVVAVTCLDQEYEEVIGRLSKMKTSPRSQMYDGQVGFGGPRAGEKNAIGQVGRGR